MFFSEQNMQWWMIWHAMILFNVCTGQTAAHDSVKLWDLRKLKNFRTLNLYDSDTPTNSGVYCYGYAFPYLYVLQFMASGCSNSSYDFVWYRPSQPVFHYLTSNTFYDEYCVKWF
jgi:hypothetical protein